MGGEPVWAVESVIKGPIRLGPSVSLQLQVSHRNRNVMMAGRDFIGTVSKGLA
jgi:hypothetical protein